jgi:glycosyltransferase involved in cell wall biosynthesis
MTGNFSHTAMQGKRNQTPRVLFVGSFMPSAALERYPSADLAVRLSALGWTTLLTARREGRFARLADVLWTIYRKRSDFDLALVDVFSDKAFFLAEAAACLLRYMRKPFILVLHGGNLPDFSERWPGRVRRLLSSATLVTTPSNYLKEKMGEFASRIECLPNPINVADYDFRLRRHPETGLIWLRAFHEIYNPVLAVKVLLELLPSEPEAHLTMVGLDKRDGSLSRTQAFIWQHQLEHRVNVVGPIEKKDVPAALQKADIFLNTSRIDNTPVSVLEAMANGLCVVSTNVGGLPFMLDDENDSLLVAPDQSKDMAQAVKRLLAEPSLAERISRNARAKAEKWDWAQLLPRWQSLLLGEQLCVSSHCCV